MQIFNFYLCIVPLSLCPIRRFIYSFAFLASCIFRIYAHIIHCRSIRINSSSLDPDLDLILGMHSFAYLTYLLVAAVGFPFVTLV
jgi:hypothetical protein